MAPRLAAFFTDLLAEVDRTGAVHATRHFVHRSDDRRRLCRDRTRLGLCLSLRLSLLLGLLRLSGRLLVSDLASAVRLSPSHFARAFKRTTGCSPHHYLLRRRIECAKERMRTTGEPLAQIALAYGFSDQAHFTRCFKRHEGETPTAWYRRVTSGSVRSRALA